MRLVTWNIHAGVGLDGKRDLKRIAQELLDLKPDILCLQEVSRRMPWCGPTDQPAILARLCDMRLTFGAETRLLWGSFGNAILTRYPIISSCRHPLPNRHERTRPGLLLERRGALEVTLDINDSPLSIFSTHWSLRMEDRMKSSMVLGTITADRCAYFHYQVTVQLVAVPNYYIKIIDNYRQLILHDCNCLFIKTYLSRCCLM